MTEPVWRVVVARRVDGALDELDGVGAIEISGHGTASSWNTSLLVRAPDKATARAKIEAALQPHPLITEIRRLPVYVHAPIEADARAAFEAAASGDPRIGGVVEDETNHTLEAYFVLEPKDGRELLNEAHGLYERVAREARLPPKPAGPMWASGLYRLFEDRSLARRHLARADRLLAEKYEPALAVVVAQTACEVAIRDVLTGLVQARVDGTFAAWIEARLRTYSLIDNQGQGMWATVTGSEIQTEDFWSEYTRHVRRRHGIVHAGDEVTVEDAEKSLQVAATVLDYVERASGLGPLR